MQGFVQDLKYSVRQLTRRRGPAVIATAPRHLRGAPGPSILRLVLGQGLALVLVSVAIGVVGALVLTQLLTGLLYGIGPRDLITYASVVGVLTSVAAIACWVPARRASSVSPQTALRYD